MAETGRIEKALTAMLEGGTKLQGPAVDKYVWRLRRANPTESPQQIIDRMERLFLVSVTGAGGAAGAAAAVPGIGTVAAIGAIGAETALFLEASALFTLGVASVHGIPVSDLEQRKALVLAVALGESGRQIVRRTVGPDGARVGALIAGRAAGIDMKGLNRTLLKKFVAKYAARRGALSLGTLLPAGIGAVVGGVGNRALGRGVVANARETFGPPPLSWATAPGVIDDQPQEKIR